MAISDYMRELRDKVGTMLLLMPSATALVFDERQRLLLVQYATRGLWGLPGGAVDPGEIPADCVVRETWEETGLYVRPLRIAGVYGGEQFRVRYHNGDLVEYVTTVFECGVVSGTLCADGEETADVKFFELEEIFHAPLAPGPRIVLGDLLERRGTACFTPPNWSPSPPRS
jgi:8-oxo-dGTP pyrophosphatase MutT (NUDIX family)